MAEEKNIATGYIGNALRSSAADHTTTFADEIFDTERQKYQNEVNAGLETTDAEIKADLEAETARATAADEANAQAITDEKNRAMAAEQAIIFDVSAHNNGAVFESISALLGNSNLDTLIPVSFRHGGMSIRFVQSSNNKYVQYRLMADEWSTTVADWQGVDDEPIAGSDNLVKSGGVADKVAELELEISGKSDKENFDTNYNDKYKSVKIDADGKIYESIDKDDVEHHYLRTKFEGGIEAPEIESAPKTEEAEYTELLLDKENKVVESRDKEGIKTFYAKVKFKDSNYVGNTETYEEDTSNIVEAKLSKNGLMYQYVTDDGVVHIPFLDSNITSCKSGALHGFANTLTSGQGITLLHTPDIKTHCNLGFHAEVTTMGEIKLTHGELNHNFGKVIIDDANVYEFNYTNNTVPSVPDGTTEPHGLAIKDFIDVSVQVVGKHTLAKLVINTNGDSFTKDITWGGARDNANVVVNSGSFKNCFLTFGGSAFYKNVWIYGDSYTDMWPLAMHDLGYDNYALDGWGGRHSNEGYESLLKGLKLGTPKVVVWMLGMNDPDTSTGINVSYKEYLDKVVNLCKLYGVHLAIATIPNTPTMRHNFKNDYARSMSGVQIIEVAKALGADTFGSSWYSGLLSSDNVHPSQAGRIAIAKFLSNEIPMIKE